MQKIDFLHAPCLTAIKVLQLSNMLYHQRQLSGTIGCSCDSCNVTLKYWTVCQGGRPKCYILYHSAYEQLYVCFLGTKCRRDLYFDAQFDRVSPPYFKGSIHRGFLTLFQECAPKLREMMRVVLSNYQPVKVTLIGHSMGGVLAMLTASLVMRHTSAIPNRAIHIFCTPRFGNGEFNNWLLHRLYLDNWRLYMTQHRYDVVTRLPPRLFGYQTINHPIKHYTGCYGFKVHTIKSVPSDP